MIASLSYESLTTLDQLFSGAGADILQHITRIISRLKNTSFLIASCLRLFKMVIRFRTPSSTIKTLSENNTKNVICSACVLSSLYFSLAEAASPRVNEDIVIISANSTITLAGFYVQ